MRATITRHVLERCFGFAEPTTRPGGLVTYECSYCGACAAAGALPHAADCQYWLALPSSVTPAAARLAEQLLRGG